MTMESPEALVEECTKELKRKGKKALKLNVVFFLMLFIGVLLVPMAGLQTAVIVISVACVLCLLYIYLT